MILTDQQISPIDTKVRRESNFSAGDTVRVHQKITEKDRTRIQVFEGTVIARKHGTEPGASFTVRRVGTDGIVVEKIFPLYTPMIDRIEIIRKVKTRRAKLYFLRGRTPRQLREKLRKTLGLPKEDTDESQQKQEEEPPQQQEEEEKPPRAEAQPEQESKEEQKETPTQ